MKQKSEQVKMLSSRELSLFFTSLGMLLQAGVRLDAGMDIIAQNLEGSTGGKVAQRCADLFEEGTAFELNEALQKAGGAPEYAVQVLNVAETSGQLAETVSALGGYYETQDKLEQTVRNAVSTPLSILGSMGAVIAFFSFVVIPMFQNVFASLGIAESAGNNFAFILARVAMLLVCLLFVVCIVIVIFSKNKNANRFFVKFKPINDIKTSISLSRFTQGLAMLLSSGISTEEALEKSEFFLWDTGFAEKLEQSKKLVSQGNSLDKVLVSQGILHGFEAKILLAASQVGNTEDAMRKISEMYRQDADRRISKLLDIIEPMLVAVLSLAVGGALLAVLVPLVNMAQVL